MSKWTKKKFDDIVRRWKNNEVSLAQAGSELHQLGLLNYRFKNAYAYLESI